MKDVYDKIAIIFCQVVEGRRHTTGTHEGTLCCLMPREFVFASCDGSRNREGLAVPPAGG